MIFVLQHDVYPHVRTTQRQKWVDKRFATYMASQNSIRTQVRNQMVANDWVMFPKRTPLILAIYLNVPGKHMHIRDTSNVLKAVEDAMQKTVYSNDAWIDCSFIMRIKQQRLEDLVMVAIDRLDSLDMDSVNPVLGWLKSIEQECHHRGIATWTKTWT